MLAAAPMVIIPTSPNPHAAFQRGPVVVVVNGRGGGPPEGPLQLGGLGQEVRGRRLVSALRPQSVSQGYSVLPVVWKGP